MGISESVQVEARLQTLWNLVDDCDECKQDQNVLQHIHGGGQENNPKVMFVFINPTHRNISSRPEYSGPRIPFLGTREIWKVFVDAGLLDPTVIERIRNGWDRNIIDTVICTIRNAGFYLTNIVKCTQPDARLPTKKTIKKKQDIFLKELEAVNPKLVVAFGTLPFEALSGTKLKLNDHYEKQMKSDKLITYPTIPVSGKSYNMYPCYFPVGRGDRKRAVELLQVLRRNCGLDDNQSL